ncbi:MAG: T9SS type A sorting domain-containing protein [Bacteroidota bacterium]|nr:T9SS type A sorting domain-containing protein [Bacteroidota bacterium]
MRLVFLLLFCFSFIVNSLAQVWSPLGGGINGSGGVFTLLANDSIGKLYAGGMFYKAENRPAMRLAEWNGASWLPVGSGMDNTVKSLAWIDGKLYAGGEFARAGGVPANCIARWDGITWEALGKGMVKTGQHSFPAAVNAIAEYQGQVYAAGVFDLADGNPVGYISRWDGTKWINVGAGFTNVAEALIVYKDELYAAGRFAQAGGKTANKIARWNGAEWNSVGQATGLQGGSAANCFTIMNGKLYVGGSFTMADGKPVNRIAVWDGATWSALGDGISLDGVFGLTNDGTNIYATGYFLTAGSKTVNHLARWDGAEWHSMGTGLGNGYGLAATILDGELVVGGTFTEVDGIQAGNVAIWGTTSGIERYSSSLFTVAPNPFRDGFSIYLEGSSGGSAYWITDISGRVVRQEELEYVLSAIFISRESLPAGIYFLQLRDGDGNTSTQKLIAE